ncbi:MAG: hypothetical protein ABII64_08265 [Elusimicrobiota bacterium]
MDNMELGVQPLDGIMARLGISNDELTLASTEQLTHKMVNKGRKGRRLTLNAQIKILRALNKAKPGNNFTVKDIFNY